MLVVILWTWSFFSLFYNAMSVWLFFIVFNHSAMFVFGLFIVSYCQSQLFLSRSQSSDVHWLQHMTVNITQSVVLVYWCVMFVAAIKNVSDFWSEDKDRLNSYLCNTTETLYDSSEGPLLKLTVSDMKLEAFQNTTKPAFSNPGQWLTVIMLDFCYNNDVGCHLCSALYCWRHCHRPIVNTDVELPLISAWKQSSHSSLSHKHDACLPLFLTLSASAEHCSHLLGITDDVFGPVSYTHLTLPTKRIV